MESESTLTVKSCILACTFDELPPMVEKLGLKETKENPTQNGWISLWIIVELVGEQHPIVGLLL